jgi:hypothetical protein
MKGMAPPGSLERNRRGAAEKERLKQKDQKIGKYEQEDGSEQVIGALIEVHRAPGRPGLLESAYGAAHRPARELQGDLAAPRPSNASRCRPSTFLIFPIFLSPFLSQAAEACCALQPFHSVESSRSRAD